MPALRLATRQADTGGLLPHVRRGGQRNAKEGRVEEAGEAVSGRRPSRARRPWQVRGQANGSAKLTPFAVRWARRMVNRGEISLTTAAAMLGVTKPTLWDAVHGYTWSHLTRRSSRRSR
jgi:hypothetical protein